MPDKERNTMSSNDPIGIEHLLDDSTDPFMTAHQTVDRAFDKLATLIPRNLRTQAFSILAQARDAHETQRKTYGERRVEAIVDPLTRVFNKKGYHEVGDLWLSAAQDLYRESGQQLTGALSVLDLNYFKNINDRYGHAVGDELLSNVGQALNEVTRSTDTPLRVKTREAAARTGGDEFAILLLAIPVQGHETVLSNVQDRINRRTAQLFSQSHPQIYADNTTHLNAIASMGSAVYGPDGEDLFDLFKVADRNLYKVKAKR